eukprot:CAMPEP_0181294246 /NCGR_PEP_ID=MMETSP1101-20121128/3493_1 /TAXON_ID=46948 /ORGANISM="Rhodomonas abbreviata, Strain Caron Lab Isolate" /LENGTH=439 /DNA_ID=CAMNT_0023398881 /DNA_START=55 /DNA_END=1370 /DNA_ORIENTATION=+
MVVNKTNDEIKNIGWWDGKKSTFSTFRKDVIALASKTSDDISFIPDLAKSLFDKLLLIQAQCKADGVAFSDKMADHSDDVWTTHLSSRDGGRMTAVMEVVKVHLYKETFGGFFPNHVKAGFADEACYTEAKEIALEKHLQVKNKLLLCQIINAIFPAGSKKDMTSTHKEFLRSILETAAIEEFMEGNTPSDIANWFAKPWLMPAVQVWTKILWRYEGLHETLDGNLLGDLNDIAESKEPIQQKNHKMELLLAPSQKAFATVEELCEHLRICVLINTIRELARGTSNFAKAGTLANNLIIATTKMNTPITMSIINNAIVLAQKHLDKIEEEERGSSALPVSTQDSPPPATDVETLKTQIAEQQRTLAVLQGQGGPAAGKGAGCGGGAGDKRKRLGGKGKPGGGGGTAYKTCSVCHKKHAGDPPEDHCYSRSKTSLEAEKA